MTMVWMVGAVVIVALLAWKVLHAAQADDKARRSPARKR